jgi:hypothetical protein
MTRRWIERLGWPMAGLLAFLCSVATITAWRVRHDPEVTARREVGGALHGILSRERGYLAGVHAYASSLDELGPVPGLPQGWRLRILATSLDNEPLLLVEADDGLRRLCIDRAGTLYESEIRPAPPIPPWQPTPAARSPQPAPGEAGHETRP